MASSGKWYGLGLKHALTDVNLATDTLYMALCTASYVPNQDTDEFLSNITNEVVGTGYTAGGKALTIVAVTYDAANNRVVLTFDPVSWPASTLTARIGVIYKHTGTASTSPLLGWQDAGVDQVSASGSITFTPDAAGVLRAAAA